MKLRPSSLPILVESPCFESGETEFAEVGTDRHAALKAALNGSYDECNMLDDESQAAIAWASEYIRTKAPMQDHPLIIERTCKINLPDFNETEIEGTPDVICGNELFDFKWRRRNYREQMAAYSLILFHSGWDIVHVHILYGAEQKSETWTWQRDNVEEFLIETLAKIDETREEKPSEYCGWCAKRLTCPALNARALAVAGGREDWALEKYHPSEITQPEQMAKALAIAKALEKWIESVEFHAKEMIVKQGLKLPGWKIQTRAGRREVTDLNQAFALSGLPAEKFLPACKVTMGELEEQYAEHHGLKKAEGKRELNAKLAPVIAQKPASEIIVREKE